MVVALLVSWSAEHVSHVVALAQTTRLLNHLNLCYVMLIASFVSAFCDVNKFRLTNIRVLPPDIESI